MAPWNTITRGEGKGRPPRRAAKGREGLDVRSLLPRAEGCCTIGQQREERMKIGNALDRRQMLLMGAAFALAPQSGSAQQPRPLKIGVMNDMSSVYSDYQGVGSVVAAQLAVRSEERRV